MKKVKSSQPSIFKNSCTELSKTVILIIKKTYIQKNYVYPESSENDFLKRT